MTIFPSSSVSSSSSSPWIVRDRDSVRDRLKNKLSFRAPVNVSSRRRPSFALPEGVGVGRRPALHPSHPRGRLLSSVCASTSSRAPLPFSDHGSHKAGSNQGSGRGGGGVAFQGRHSPGFNDFSRPSFSHLRRSKERRRVAPHHQPEVAQQGVLGSATFPDGHGE